MSSGGPVGGFLSFGSDAIAPAAFGQPVAWGAYPHKPLPAAPGITLEFLIKPNPGFLRGSSAFLFLDGELPSGLTFHISVASMTFAVGTTGPARTNTLQMSLGGVGPLAADYLWSGPGQHGGWHHIAAKMDAASGKMAVWIDGQSTPEMRQVVNASTSIVVMNKLLVDAENIVRLGACLDEIAVFPEALPDSLIFQHFQDTLVHHRPYSNADPGAAAAPAPPLYPNASSSAFYNREEYLPGTVLPSPQGNNNTRVASDADDVSCVAQLHAAPAPRFNITSVEKYRTPYNFNWADPHFMAGANDPVFSQNNTNMTVALQQILVRKWRYAPMLWSLPMPIPGYEPKPWIPKPWVPGAPCHGPACDCMKWRPCNHGAEMIALANAHPEWPFNVIAPFGHIFKLNQSHPDGCYLQSASGHFINVDGTPVKMNGTVAIGRRSLRPMTAAMAQEVGCPDSLWEWEGEQLRDLGFAQLSKYLSRPLSIVNLDGEVFASLDVPAEDYNYSHDPRVLRDFKLSGLPNWLTYWSAWRARLTKRATDPYMTDPQLRNGILKDAYLTMYQVQGTDRYFGNWSQIKTIGSPMPSGLDRSPKSYYSTTGMYMEGPGNWWKCSGGDHGLCWVDMSRQSELREGDSRLFSPFVAAGWRGKAEENVRPPQWLGLLKLLAAWGAEWFYTGFFNTVVDSHGEYPPASQWCWQGMMPALAQAVFTQAGEFLYQGELVLADANTTYAVPTDARNAARTAYRGSPLLWAGQPNILAIVRRFESSFLITLATQRNSNAKLNLPNTIAAASIRIPGLSNSSARAIQLDAALQGSVYVYHPGGDSNDAPVLYQLDAWHEASHPVYWKRQANVALALLEAELFSGHLAAAAVLRTMRSGASVSVSDFRGAQTCVDLATAAEIETVVAYQLDAEHSGLARPGGQIAVRALATRGGSVQVNGAGMHPETQAERQVGGRSVEEGRWVWLTSGVVNLAISERILVLSGSACVDRLELTVT
eukprot:COSAG06_NODE_1348_length_9778_cov_6.672280_7_plen_990_part_00